MSILSTHYTLNTRSLQNSEELGESACPHVNFETRSNFPYIVIDIISNVLLGSNVGPTYSPVIMSVREPLDTDITGA